MSLKEINDHYQYSSIYDGEIIPRTFARYKDYIAETFPCYIDYNQSTNQYFLKRYHQYGQEDSLYNYGATDKPCGEGVRTLTQNCC